jgi:hypothetical protein
VTASGTLRIALVTLALAVSTTPLAAQTTPSETSARNEYDFGMSSVPMLRNAQVFTLAGALVDRAANVALDEAFGSDAKRRGAMATWRRIARLWFIDAPIASLSMAGNHEFGHVLRVGWPSDYVMHVTDWPWPVPAIGLKVTTLAPTPNPLWVLSPIAGGIEADFVNAERSLDRMYESGRISPYDVVQFAFAKAARSLYILSGWEGDPDFYAETLTAMRLKSFTAPPDTSVAEFARTRTALRNGAWFNLLDYALVAGAKNVLVDYVARGEPIVEPGWLKVGRLRLVPSANYVFTPHGPQYQAGTRVRMAGGIGSAYVRWTQSLKVDSVSLWSERFTPQVPFRTRLIGGGIEFHSTSPGPIAPTVALDAWRDVDGHGGGRLELGASVHASAFGPRRAIRFAVGGKTRGYLPGFAETHGLYVNGGLTASF